MSFLRFTLVLLLAAALCACEREDKLLLGDWRAITAQENGDSLRLDPAEIAFSFHPDNRYRYTSTLRYQEAGTWRYENGFLFARDTTTGQNEERIVAVELLTVDSLLLRMRADTAERHILLLRQSAPPE